MLLMDKILLRKRSIIETVNKPSFFSEVKTSEACNFLLSVIFNI